MRFAKILGFWLVLMGLMYPVWADRVSPPATSCFGEPWNGTNCVQVTYQAPIVKLALTKDMVTQILASVDALAKKENVNATVSQSNYNVTSENGVDHSTYMLYGWVQYALPTPEDANNFVTLLQANHYDASQGTGEAMCPH